jgi:hypothetical protein
MCPCVCTHAHSRRILLLFSATQHRGHTWPHREVFFQRYRVIAFLGDFDRIYAFDLTVFAAKSIKIRDLKPNLNRLLSLEFNCNINFFTIFKIGKLKNCRFCEMKKKNNFVLFFSQNEHQIQIYTKMNRADIKIKQRWTEGWHEFLVQKMIIATFS